MAWRAKRAPITEATANEAEVRVGVVTGGVTGGTGTVREDVTPVTDVAEVPAPPVAVGEAAAAVVQLN